MKTQVDAPELFQYARQFFEELLSIRSAADGTVSIRDLGKATGTLGVVAPRGRKQVTASIPLPPCPVMVTQSTRTLKRRTAARIGHALGIGDDRHHRKLLCELRQGDETQQEQRLGRARDVAARCWEHLQAGDRHAARVAYLRALPDVRMEVRALVRTTKASEGKRTKDVERLWRSGHIHGSVEAGWALIECLHQALLRRGGQPSATVTLPGPDGKPRKHKYPAVQSRPWIVVVAPSLFDHAAGFFAHLSRVGALRDRWTTRALVNAGCFKELGVAAVRRGRPRVSEDEAIRILSALAHLQDAGMKAIDAQTQIEERLEQTRRPIGLKRIQDTAAEHRAAAHGVGLVTHTEREILAGDLVEGSGSLRSRRKDDE